jgi:hypothetical protein
MPDMLEGDYVWVGPPPVRGRVAAAIRRVAAAIRRVAKRPAVAGVALAVLLLGIAVSLLLTQPTPRDLGQRGVGSHSSPLGGPPDEASGPVAGSRVVVPSLAGRTALQAWKRLTGAGLRVKNVRPVDGRPGVVVRTSPAPNASVRRGSAVVL